MKCQYKNKRIIPIEIEYWFYNKGCRFKENCKEKGNNECTKIKQTYEQEIKKIYNLNNKKWTE